ncbi:MAG: hypothetical protein U0797_21810 [Gemmataceae bacterium]
MRWLLAPWRFACRHGWRTLAYDLRTLPLTPWEARRLDGRGVEDDATRHYLAWRRSNLLVAGAATAFAAAAHSLVALTFYLEFPNLFSRLGVAVQTARHAALFALPVASFVALALWARPRASYRVVLLGWVVSFLVPVLLSFVPPHQLFALGRLTEAEQQKVVEAAAEAVDFPVGLTAAAERVRQGFTCWWTSSSARSSPCCCCRRGCRFCPASSRACARIKVMLPGSSLPGWSLITTAPLYSFGFLVLLVLVHQVTGSWLLLASALLFAVAPLVYLVKAPLLLRPAAREPSAETLRSVQLVSSAMGAAAAACLCVYLATLEVRFAGQTWRGFGLDPETSLVQPWTVFQFVVEYLGRSFYMTVLVADLVLRMHCLVWAEDRPFRESPHHAEYESAMRGLHRHVGPG